MVFFCVKRFWPITRVENNSQEKSTILHVPHIGFLCYSNWDQILLYGRWLKVRMNICTALWSFVNFCCLSQSEVSTDNRKVSTFLAFQHVRCHCCYRSYLDCYLKKKENSNTRKLRTIFRAPGENRTHDPPSSSSDALTTELLEL